MKFDQSSKLHKQALKLMPGGVNSPVRSFLAVGLNPSYIVRGEGSHIYDIDGNKYIDYICGWGSNILGHGNQKIKESIQNTLNNGIGFGTPNENEIKLAKLVIKNFSFIEKLRFTNSGSEAVQAAIRLARAVTNKNKIIKFNGCYHGHADYLLVKSGSGLSTFSKPDSAGVPNTFAKETITIEFNDLNQVKSAVKKNKNQIATIIVEPIAGNMGMILPKVKFLEGLKTICKQNDILLIFDEIITGFRVSPGGCTKLYNIKPDIITLGKTIGGGLPIGCFGSSNEIMENISPLGSVYQAGTFSGNPIVMSAGVATLEQLSNQTIFNQLSTKTTQIADEFKLIADKIGIAFQSQAIGGMFGYFFNNKKINNFSHVLSNDSKFFAQFFKQMFIRGIYLAPSLFETSFITNCHSNQDIELTIKAFKESLEYLSSNKIFPNPNV